MEVHGLWETGSPKPSPARGDSTSRDGLPGSRNGVAFQCGNSPGHTPASADKGKSPPFESSHDP